VSKVKHDGWGYKYRWSERIYPPIFHDKATLIRKFEYGIKNRWRNARRAGTVKAVKVRIVEVEEEMTTPEYKSECHGADYTIEFVVFEKSGKKLVRICSKCHKPCSVAELPKASTVRKEEGDE